MDELEKMRVKRDLRLPRDLARPSPKSPKDGSPVHKTPAETTAHQAAHQAAQQAAHRYASKTARKAARKAAHKDAHKHALKTAPKTARKTALARKAVLKAVGSVSYSLYGAHETDEQPQLIKKGESVVSVVWWV